MVLKVHSLTGEELVNTRGKKKHTQYVSAIRFSRKKVRGERQSSTTAVPHCWDVAGRAPPPYDIMGYWEHWLGTGRKQAMQCLDADVGRTEELVGIVKGVVVGLGLIEQT